MSRVISNVYFILILFSLNLITALNLFYFNCYQLSVKLFYFTLGYLIISQLIQHRSRCHLDLTNDLYFICLECKCWLVGILIEWWNERMKRDTIITCVEPNHRVRTVRLLYRKQTFSYFYHIYIILLVTWFFLLNHNIIDLFLEITSIGFELATGFW